MKFKQIHPRILTRINVSAARGAIPQVAWPAIALTAGTLCAGALLLHAQNGPSQFGQATTRPSTQADSAQSSPTPAPSSPTTPSASQTQAPAPSPADAPAPPQLSAGTDDDHKRKHGDQEEHGGITEDQLKQMLVGKQLFLRGAYLGDSLSFGEHGNPVGHPAVGSYTLSGVEIEKVHLTKHKVELIGARYGLHFLGALPYDDPSKAVERVKITPKKKMLKITIDREQVVKPKKVKEAKGSKGKSERPAQPATASVASSETDVVTAAQPASTGTVASAPESSATGEVQVKPTSNVATPNSAAPDTANAEAEPAAASSGEDATDKPADQASVTTTASPAHSAEVLRQALDRIFAPGLDDKERAQMPQFWQLYFKAQAAGVDYRPQDPNVFRSNAVDQPAKLLTSIAPQSNEFAQASGIAGQALYRVVIGADGKPGEIAVERPIGFGLDENAVSAIRKATFSPAEKNGQPVAETLDLAVLFRIYSKRTSVAATGEAKAAEPVKPGPYSVKEQH